MLLSNLDLLATAPDGVARLRELILTLAAQGKLVPQDPADEPASVLLQKIRAKKDRLIAEGKIKRDKPLVEMAEEEKPFEVPTQWEWVRLIDLMPEFQNGASSRGDEGGTQITVLRLADIKDKRISLAATRQVPIAPSDIAKYQLAEGDILITRVNGSADIVGQFNLCDRPVEAIYCDHFIRMRIDRRWVEPSFCALLGGSALVRTAIKSLFITTAGQKTVNQGHLGSLQFPLPPLAEQSRIVTRVEELMRLCDALQAKGQLEAAQHAQLVSTLLGTLTGSTTTEEMADNWQRVAQHFDLLLDRPEAIDALEQTLLQLAVRGLLVPQDPQDEPASALLQRIRTEKDRLIAAGQIKRDKPLPPITEEEKPFELPVGWEWCQLDELVTIRGGKRVSNGYQLLTAPTEFIYIRVSDMKDGSIDDSDLRYLDAEMRSAISRYIIKKDDIYMTIVGATIGKCGLVPDRFDGMNLTENAARLTPHLVSKDYLFRLLASEFCQVQFLGKTKQVGVQKMALNRLAGTLIPLPPLAEQSRIVTRIAALRGLCADLRQHLKAAQATQSRLVGALVSEVVAS